MNVSLAFRPKWVDALKGYTRQDLHADVIAGRTVGILALPLAFPIASGVKPEAGIFPAVIAGFLMSALGGSRVAIGGPTGTFIVILHGIHAKCGAENLTRCTMRAGVNLFVMGAARLGTMIKSIPSPVALGFTSAMAVLISATHITAVEDSTRTEGSHHSLAGTEVPNGVEEGAVEGWVRNEGVSSVADRGRLLFDHAQVGSWAAVRGLAAKAGHCRGRLRHCGRTNCRAGSGPWWHRVRGTRGCFHSVRSAAAADHFGRTAARVGPAG